MTSCPLWSLSSVATWVSVIYCSSSVFDFMCCIRVECFVIKKNVSIENWGGGGEEKRNEKSYRTNLRNESNLNGSSRSRMCTHTKRRQPLMLGSWCVLSPVSH